MRVERLLGVLNGFSGCETDKKKAKSKAPRFQKPKAWATRNTLRAPNKTSTPAAWVRSLQLCVLRFGLLQDGDVGVGVFPQS